MNIKNIIIASALIAAIGLIIAILLSVAEKVFHVEVDERVELIRAQLAVNNCGACGYAGCDALAKAIADGSAPADACPVSGKESTDKIADIMGVAPSEYVRKTAFVKCGGNCNSRQKTANYYGVKECTYASVVNGGSEKSCAYGCFGYGSCATVCDNNAIEIIDGVAVINENLCVSCGKCVDICPLNLIEIVPYSAKYRVACSNKLKGKAVKDNCRNGCIACGMCERSCPQSAVKLTDNIASIDYSACSQCGLCAQKCPTKAILTFAK